MEWEKNRQSKTPREKRHQRAGTQSGTEIIGRLNLIRPLVSFREREPTAIKKRGLKGGVRKETT